MKTNYLVKVEITFEGKNLPFKGNMLNIVSTNDLGALTAININAAKETLDNSRLRWKSDNVAVVENETAKVTIEFETLAVNGVPVFILELMAALE